jgi:hypothetical protein
MSLFCFSQISSEWNKLPALLLVALNAEKGIRNPDAYAGALAPVTTLPGIDGPEVIGKLPDKRLD